ncbi:unnamed protein product [Arabis nemorensis]|uniref:Uncharacterized protein n=1 Tax=Arabis nemorensis TaxID=586526 RepID=A0A565AUY9_9BRAS|nr:unnamed protein product [Arabis nemorensis]
MELASRRRSIGPATGDMAHGSGAILQRLTDDTTVKNKDECGSEEDDESCWRFHWQRESGESGMGSDGWGREENTCKGVSENWERRGERRIFRCSVE